MYCLHMGIDCKGEGGCEGLPGWFVHFVAHFGNVQKQMEEIGSEKSTLWCPFDSGSGGLKLCGQCPYGNNTLKKGLPYRP